MSDGNEFFEKGVLAMIALIADPKASAARLAELQRVAAENAKAAAKVEADREALNAETAAAKAEIVEDRRRAAGAWRASQESALKAAAQLERAEAYAAKVGYYQRPTHMDIGTSGAGMVLFDGPTVASPAAPVALDMVVEAFPGGASGGQMVPRPATRIRRST